MVQHNWDWKTEKLIPLADSGKLLPCGSIFSIRTIKRWALEGLISKTTGKRVFLKHQYIGGTPFTSQRAVDRFLDELNGEGDTLEDLQAHAEAQDKAAARKPPRAKA